MSIKYSVLRIGDPSDRGPNGECGIVLVGTLKEGGKEWSHGETVYCAEAHQHSKACAQAMLDHKPVLGKDDKGADILGPSARERIQAWMNEAEPAPADVAPLPKKEVEQVVDGKAKKIQVEDRDLG